MLQYDYSTFALFERIAVNDAVECVKVARNGLAACSNAAGAIVVSSHSAPRSLATNY